MSMLLYSWMLHIYICYFLLCMCWKRQTFLISVNHRSHQELWAHFDDGCAQSSIFFPYDLPGHFAAFMNAYYLFTMHPKHYVHCPRFFYLLVLKNIYPHSPLYRKIIHSSDVTATIMRKNITWIRKEWLVIKPQENKHSSFLCIHTGKSHGICCILISNMITGR